MTDKTRTYQQPDEENTTQTYQSDATRTYSDATRTYDEERQRATGTRYRLNIGDTVTLNEILYRITGLISEHTGEAVIYTIQDQQDQVFALKLYFEFSNSKEEPNPEALRRIQKINDPDILRLHAFGTGTNKYLGKYCFEICDIAKGGNLLTRRDYSLEFLKGTVIPQIFRGIRTLHDHKIYHCDLKPENIFWLDAEYTDLVIGDYGSAKTFEDSSDKDLRQTTTAKGTMFYLAPEQFIGIISAKNDYYSFGMILLHLLYPNFVNRESLRKIRERQMSKKPITDYDPRFGEFNDLIAGLTLADLSVRWGETQVLQWMRGEDIAVSYGYSADVHPIKLGKTPIRTPQDLIRHIESNTDWYDDLIEDSEGYRQLLRWIADIEDLGRKKVFDKMVRNYQQDGKEFLKTAILRYFDPERPVHLDMKVYDFWNAPDFKETVNQFFQHLDESAQVTGINKRKFYLFQLEFVLRQIEAMTEGQAKLIAASILNKIEGVFNLSPKKNFDDYACEFYPKVSKRNFLILLSAFGQRKSVNSILMTFKQGLANIVREFDNAEKSFDRMNSEYLENQRQVIDIQRTISNTETLLKRLHSVSPGVLPIIAYGLTGMLFGLFMLIREDEVFAWWEIIGGGIMLAIIWPLGLITGCVAALAANDSTILSNLFGAMFSSLILTGLLYAVFIFGVDNIESRHREQNEKISILHGKNESIQNSLNRRQQIYDELKRKKLTIETQIAHLKKEIRRVQTL